MLDTSAQMWNLKTAAREMDLRRLYREVGFNPDLKYEKIDES